MQVDYFLPSSTCPWSVVTGTGGRAKHWTCESRRNAPHTEATHCQHTKPSGPEDVKSTQDLSMRQVEPFRVLPCPCLVCFLFAKLKVYSVNVKKTNFWEWGGGVWALITPVGCSLYTALFSPPPSVCPGGRRIPSWGDRTPLPWLSAHFLLFDAGVALKEWLVKTNHHLLLGKKNEKKEKKNPVFYLCVSLNFQRSYCPEREQGGFYLPAPAGSHVNIKGLRALGGG